MLTYVSPPRFTGKSMKLRALADCDSAVEIDGITAGRIMRSEFPEGRIRMDVVNHRPILRPCRRRDLGQCGGPGSGQDGIARFVRYVAGMGGKAAGAGGVAWVKLLAVPAFERATLRFEV